MKERQITVFGANGKVGTKVVDLLLNLDYKVQAAVHHPKNQATHSNLKVVTCDIHKPDQVAQSLQGSSAVISCLGSWGTKTKDIQTSGMRTIIPAMQVQKITRIVSLTGSGVRLPSDEKDLLNDMSLIAMKIVARKIYNDGLRHLELLAESNLDWTVLRSPIMTRGKSKGYLLDMKRPRPWKRIERNDVADALVALLEDKAYSKTSPFIHQGE